ncbi:MAG: DmsE family decaheme c-type cytochrome [Acidobacteria bacterium]|nr:DmsE family decaheme c-type cytochrome [Acidobacteriota bacterium]
MNITESRLAKIIKSAVVFGAMAAFLYFIFLPNQRTAAAQPKSADPVATVGATSAFSTEATNPGGQHFAQDDSACASCHEQIAQNLSKTVHGKAKKSAALLGSHAAANVAAVSCQNCHGDGAEHIANGGDATKIKNPAKLNAFEASQNCMQCHSQTKTHSNWRGSKHETAGLSCLNCHSAHHSPVSKLSESQLFDTTQAENKLLKQRTEADTCYQCHADVRKAQFQRSSHLFRNESREQQITCSSCHEAHGGIGGKLMRTATANETCYQCHAEKRGPFLFEHSPVRENCASCHKAHGSNNPSLLAAKSPMLCQQCHIQGRHQTVPGVPNSAFTLSRGCVNCHSQIHGSNHPSGINLQR